MTMVNSGGNGNGNESGGVYKQRSEDVKDFEVDERIVGSGSSGGPYGISTSQIVQE